MTGSSHIDRQVTCETDSHTSHNITGSTQTDRYTHFTHRQTHSDRQSHTDILTQITDTHTDIHTHTDRQTYTDRQNHMKTYTLVIHCV